MRAFSFLLLLALFSSGCGETPPATDAATETATTETAATWTPIDSPSFLQDREIFQPQVFLDDSGTPIYIWREKAADGDSDLYAARWSPGNPDTLPPTRLNAEPGMVQGWNHDENRAAVAVGPSGQVAVGWSTGGGDVMAAVSRDGGATFGEEIRLNQDDAPAYHAFPALSFAKDGSLHAVWIDARAAGNPRAEEPADLYHAQIAEDGGVEEHNLTPGDDASVCGCCRLHLAPEGDGLVADFRYVVEGYRDIHSLRFAVDGSVAAPPERFGPQMWELAGCPSAGPLRAHMRTLWNEASTGAIRLLEARDTDGSFEVVMESGDTWKIRRPPRPVEGAGDTLLLVPGDPGGRLLAADGEDGDDDGWTILDDNVPAWATSAVVIDGTLFVLGGEDGVARMASRGWQGA